MALRSETTDVYRFHKRASPAARAMLALKTPFASRVQVGRSGWRATVPCAAGPLEMGVAETMQISTAVTPAQPWALADTCVALMYRSCPAPAASLLAAKPGADIW